MPSRRVERVERRNLCATRSTEGARMHESEKKNNENLEAVLEYKRSPEF
jgi:hypothetical protein